MFGNSPAQQLLIFILIFIPASTIFPHSIHAQIVVNEFVPDPDDANDFSQWIELYNLSSNVENLAGYSLDDQDGGTKPFELAGKQISPQSFLVIEKSESKISLNNAGDSVRLLKADQIMDEITYSDIPVNHSYGRQNDGGHKWQIFENPTKGASNHPIQTAGTVFTPSNIKNKRIYGLPQIW